MWFATTKEGKAVELNELPYPECADKYFKLLGLAELSRVAGINYKRLSSYACRRGLAEKYRTPKEKKRALDLVNFVYFDGTATEEEKVELNSMINSSSDLKHLIRKVEKGEVKDDKWAKHRTFLLQILKEAGEANQHPKTYLERNHQMKYQSLLRNEAGGSQYTMLNEIEKLREKEGISPIIHFWPSYAEKLAEVILRANNKKLGANRLVEFMKSDCIDLWIELTDTKGKTPRSVISALAELKRGNLDHHLSKETIKALAQLS